MKIALSVFGRFHIFNTAEELSKKNIINQFYTTYPEFFVSKYQIQEGSLTCYPTLEILNRLRRKFFKKLFPDSIFLKKIYDKKIAKSLSSDNDIYISWGGYAYDSMRKSKSYGQTIILEIGSTHPRYVQKILQDEYTAQGLIPKLDSEENISWQLKSIEMADYIAIPSSFVKRSFLENGVPECKLIVNPYGVDLSAFRPVKKTDDVFRVIFCGALSLQKGSHYLLKAIHELNLDNLEFWHIGNVLDEMDVFIKKYESEKIIYKGSYPQNELYELYSQGSVFVMPSIQDGLALVQLQAMACGLPLICTTNTGGDDLITEQGKEGFVIPIRDVNAIKDKITYLYKNPIIRDEMGNNAKERVKAGYTWADYGERYYENLRMIIDKN
ncbi:MAG: glycosyltransferase family 4 protein [Gammaproteobacteria bacterium]|nr:glycosyltransferase family 4 protein [Gammaproteobacteria bacterium]